MDDDGSRRDSFVRYLCLVLGEAGKPEGEMVIITAWDQAAMAKDELKEIGKAACR